MNPDLKQIAETLPHHSAYGSLSAHDKHELVLSVRKCVNEATPGSDTEIDVILHLLQAWHADEVRNDLKQKWWKRSVLKEVALGGKVPPWISFNENGDTSDFYEMTVMGGVYYDKEWGCLRTHKMEFRRFETQPDGSWMRVR